MAKNKKILIVEDSADVREVIIDQLKEKTKFDLIEFDLCNPAKEFLRLNTVDLIVLDLVLPDGHGSEILKIAHEKRIKVLIITGYEVSYIDNDMVLSYLDFLVKKPFDLKLFVERIKGMLK